MARASLQTPYVILNRETTLPLNCAANLYPLRDRQTFAHLISPYFLALRSSNTPSISIPIMGKSPTTQSGCN
jgi:hypothetical protein